jgi:hypothetical protein
MTTGNLRTVAATGLFAMCATSCGGGGSSAAKNSVADTCNRLQTCGDLAAVGASTVAECTDGVNQQLNAMTSSDGAAFTQGLDQCLAKSDCPSYSTCLSTLLQSTITPAVCNHLQSCGSLSRLSSSASLTNCETYAGQLLGGLSGSSHMVTVGSNARPMRGRLRLHLLLELHQRSPRSGDRDIGPVHHDHRHRQLLSAPSWTAAAPSRPLGAATSRRLRA